MAQNFKKIMIDEIAKDVYLPLFNNLSTTEPSAFFAEVKKEGLSGNTIKGGAPWGILGGFGYSEEGKNTPLSGRQNYKGFKNEARDMYVDLTISYKATILGNDKGTLVNVLDNEIRSAFTTANWHIGRSVYGDGTGVLTNISAMGSSGNTVTVESTKNLIEGMTVDFYKTGDTVGTEPAVKARRIKFIDRVNKTVTFDGDPVALEAGFMTVQNSYGLEIEGLGAIFNDEIAELYSVKKSDFPIIKPVVIDCQNDAVTDRIIREGIRESADHKGGQTNMLLCGYDAYQSYVNSLAESNIRVEDRVGELTGGWKAAKHLYNGKEVSIIEDKFIPDNEIWGVDTKSFSFASTGWNFVEKDGGVFNLMENQSVYRALLANYGNMICSNPGACIRYKNIGG